MMRSSIGIAVALVVVNLGACGGGSSSPSPVSSAPPPVSSTDASPDGHWYGTLTNEFNAVTEEYVALIDGSGRFRFVSADSAIQMSGNLLVTGNDLTGEGTAFADTGVVWLNGSSAIDVSLVGNVAERDSISGSWSSASGEFGSFEFYYDPTFYERSSELATLAGTWIAYDELLNPEVTFTILADGSFTGQNSLGCNSVGQIYLIDAAYNLFELQSTISDCAIAGDYAGFAVLADLLTRNDAFLVAIDNGSRAIALGFEK